MRKRGFVGTFNLDCTGGPAQDWISHALVSFMQRAQSLGAGLTRGRYRVTIERIGPEDGNASDAVVEIDGEAAEVKL